MLPDYDEYSLSFKEWAIFYLGGYFCLFIMGYIFYRSIWLSLIVGCVIVFFHGMYVTYLIKMRKERLLAGFKDFLYSLSSSMASSRSMAEGIEDALIYLKGIYDEKSDIMREISYMNDEIREKHENEAFLLDSLGKRSHLEDIEGFSDVYLSVRETGGDMVGVISRTIKILMDKIMIEKEIRTMISQKKLESAIIAVMPVVIIGTMNLTSSSYLEPMYESLEGRSIMTLALAGLAAAYVLIVHITDIKV